MKQWAYQSPAGAVRYSTAEATKQATTFGLIVANRGVYGPNVAAMRRANPDLWLSGYLNGAYAQRTQATAYPDAWYLRDAHGEKVRSKGYGNFLMDVSNPGWINDVANRARAMLGAGGYDDAFLDMMGAASVTSGYGTGVPLDPDTGAVITRTEWLAATTALSAKVRTLIGRPLLTNGIGSGPAYFHDGSPTSVLFGGCDGSLAEYWLRGAGEPLDRWPSEKQWKQNLDMLLDASRKGRQVLITVKTWVPGTAAAKEAWHRFSLATYLLGADGTHAYQFLGDDSPEAMTAPDPMLAGVDLGLPQGVYTKVAPGVYAREFARGRVTVNTTTHQGSWGG